MLIKYEQIFFYEIATKNFTKEKNRFSFVIFYMHFKSFETLHWFLKINAINTYAYI